MDKFEFLETDFEFVGDKQDITKDVVAPAVPAWKDAMRRFSKNKGAVIGFTFIVVVILLAIFAPMLSTWKFDDINTAIKNVEPNATHWFGTDAYGRDLWVRLWTGTRYSLFIAVAAI